MKKRILTGWTIQRVIYLVLGTIIIAQSVKEQQWALVLAGGYFAAMGLFAFGCASGNCYGGSCCTENKTTQNLSTEIIPVKPDQKE